MKLIPLSQQGKNKGKYFAQVDDEDYDALTHWRWSASNQQHTVYATRSICEVINGKKILYAMLMHRVILGIKDENMDGEHKDRNGLNNQRANLRTATRQQNIFNTGKRKSATTSEYKGVSKKILKGRYEYWYAQIQINGKIKCLGLHKTEDEAAQAYNDAAIKLHGEFANLNIIKV